MEHIPVAHPSLFAVQHAIRLSILALAFVALSACGGSSNSTLTPTASHSPSSSSNTGTTTSTASRLASSSQPIVTSIDEVFLAIDNAEPGFGGYFFTDAGATLNIYLTDPTTQLDNLKASVKQILGDNQLDISKYQLNVLQGQYSFAQLKEWQNLATQNVLAIPGVVFTDAQEATNRVNIGVVNDETGAIVRKQLSELGVPNEAVTIEITAPINAYSSGTAAP